MLVFSTFNKDLYTEYNQKHIADATFFYRMMSMVLDKRNMSEEQMIKGCLRKQPSCSKNLIQ